MSNTPQTQSQSSDAVARRPFLSSLKEGLKGQRIAYLTLPLLIMATMVEFVILATGWKYQQAVCLPAGMGVTFLGIGPIGATILAVEALKLPLAVWTAGRVGWPKVFMLFFGLPLICLLTFQLVKDMAVYEMTTAMAPANELLEKASGEQIRVAQLNGELAAIEGKKGDRELKLAELEEKEASAKAQLDEALKLNQESRQDAITLTDYQKQELSEVEARQTTIIKQFDADAAQLTLALAELRARRETEVARATKWNAEEARIENGYKTEMAEYSNTLADYEREQAKYDDANFVKRKLMKEPVHPGVPPVREDNTILKPTLVKELDGQINAKDVELAAVNERRRDRVAQVATDARQLREDFDQRSSTKRDEVDGKREGLLAAHAALVAQWKTEREEIDQELTTAVQKVDGIRKDIDGHHEKAEGFYQAREDAIRDTQVHRIATTVEIVRGLLFSQRPVSITATARERGDILTDQISMVRIWVYPVLALIVAFLPTLMVEVGVSTIIKPERQRRSHRVGFFGRRLHAVYNRAGHLKLLRAERLAKETSTRLGARDRALAEVNASAETALAAKTEEVQAARKALNAATAAHQEEARKKEEGWVEKVSGMADSLNRAVIEKDALRDLQKSEIERQIQMRQNAWSDRLTQMRQELDDQRTAAEEERTTLLQEQQQKLMEVTESCKTEVIQARRQMANTELAAVDKTAKQAQDFKEAVHTRDEAESQLKHQADAFQRQLSQVQEDAARELEKRGRLDQHRYERQKLEHTKALGQHEDDSEHRWTQREQELTLGFEARLAEDKSRLEKAARQREEVLEEQIDARADEVESRWKQEVQKRDEVGAARLHQREQQLQAQAEARLRDIHAQAEEQLRRKESEFERKLDSQGRDTELRLSEKLQQRDLAYHAQLKQREQELTNRAAAREAELREQSAADLRTREEESRQQADSRIRAAETRMAQEVHQKEEDFQLKLRQREQQMQSQLDSRQAELKTQWEQELRRRDVKAAAAQQREEELLAEMAAQAEAHERARNEWDVTRASFDPIRARLVRTEQERDEAKRNSSDVSRKVKSLEQKLTEASSFLNGLKGGNGEPLTITRS